MRMISVILCIAVIAVRSTPLHHAQQTEPSQELKTWVLNMYKQVQVMEGGKQVYHPLEWYVQELLKGNSVQLIVGGSVLPMSTKAIKEEFFSRVTNVCVEGHNFTFAKEGLVEAVKPNPMGFDSRLKADTSIETTVSAYLSVVNQLFISQQLTQEFNKYATYDLGEDYSVISQSYVVSKDEAYLRILSMIGSVYSYEITFKDADFLAKDIISSDTTRLYSLNRLYSFVNNGVRCMNSLDLIVTRQIKDTNEIQLFFHSSNLFSDLRAPLPASIDGQVSKIEKFVDEFTKAVLLRQLRIFIGDI